MGDGAPVEQEIVGVVGNSLFNNLREPMRPMVYSALGSLNGAALEIRTVPEPRVLAATLRREIEAIDPGLHVRDSILQSTRIANTLVSERLLAWLAVFFAVAAIVLAAVGLNGVINYFVVRRTREIGIRMALGAERQAILRLIVRNVAALIGLGIIGGAAVGLALARYAESLLFEVKPEDFWSLAAPLAGILGACILAAIRPAVRAARLDPVITLRYE
jgi:putative ABC transport system permease protein